MENEINELKINMAEIIKDIGYIKNALDLNTSEHKIIILKIDNFVQSAEDRFAAKSEHKESINKIKDLSELIDHKYVTKDEFFPLKKFFYISVGALVVTIIGAIMALILR